MQYLLSQKQTIARFWRLLLVVGALAGGAAAEPIQTLTVYNDATGDTYIELGQPDGIGDQILWHSDMQTTEGEVVGTGSGHCTQLDRDANFFCTFTIDLTDRGILSGQGVQLTEPLESTFPITGGTGEFKGIIGNMTATPVEDRARFIYKIEYSIAQ